MLLGYKAQVIKSGQLSTFCNYRCAAYPSFLKISNAGVYAFYVVTNIKHNAGEEIEYQRKAHCQERRIDKKQPDLIDRYIKALAQIGTNPERVSFKKC